MRKFKSVAVCAMAIILVFSLSGCAMLESFLGSAKREIVGEELLARAFCHEIDHLDGILYIDKVKR